MNVEYRLKKIKELAEMAHIFANVRPLAIFYIDKAIQLTIPLESLEKQYSCHPKKTGFRFSLIPSDQAQLKPIGCAPALGATQRAGRDPL